MRYCINTFKGATFLWVIFLMNYFNNYSTGMYLYLTLHGSYGIAWILKDVIFPDGRFMAKASIGSNVLCFLFLCGYWMISVPLAAGYGINEPSKERIVFLVVLYVLGLVLMLGSDYQKAIRLKKQPGLISDGFFKYSRNPNYLGEIFIYSSFVLCSGHFLGFCIFYGLACVFFALNIYLKDKLSYEKKKGWEEYRKQSYILLPKIFPTFAVNFVFYASASMSLFYFLASESPSTFKDYGFFKLAQEI